jgi:hypothetical protein
LIVWAPRKPSSGCLKSRGSTLCNRNWYAGQPGTRKASPSIAWIESVIAGPSVSVRGA